MKHFFRISIVCILFFISCKTSAQAPTTSVPPKSVAISTWQMFRGGTEHHAQQLQKGGFTTATPVLKWEFTDPTPPGNNGGGEGEPAVGDVNGDGITEVISAFKSRANAIVGSTGALLWVYTTGGQINGSPAIGDVNNDGNMEVIICSDKTYALNGATGTVLWSFTGTPAGPFNSSPAIADVVAGGGPEVIVTCDNGKVYCLNGTTGAMIWSYTIINTTENFWASPVVGDINNN
ncbi:MAG: outer membrane protein assembly factor BamB family protein, partial [Bacteroidota bacterium]